MWWQRHQLQPWSFKDCSIACASGDNTNQGPSSVKTWCVILKARLQPRCVPRQVYLIFLVCECLCNIHFVIKELVGWETLCNACWIVLHIEDEDSDFNDKGMVEERTNRGILNYWQDPVCYWATTNKINVNLTTMGGRCQGIQCNIWKRAVSPKSVPQAVRRGPK